MYSKTLERMINAVQGATAKVTMYGAIRKFDKENKIKTPWKRESKLMLLIVFLVILSLLIGWYYAKVTIVIPPCNCTMWY
jgi:hypothetical protein